MNYNTSLNKRMFNGAKKYLLRCMINNNKPKVYLSYKQRLIMMVSSVKCSMGTPFKEADCLQVQIIRTKWNIRQESLSLENNNHVETCGTHRHKQDKGDG